MTADFRLAAISAHGNDVRRVALDRGWVAALSRCGFALRAVDVGAPVVVETIALSAVELARVNEAARQAAASLMPVDALRVGRTCDDVAAAIAWAGDAAYYSPWFVVEAVDID